MSINEQSVYISHIYENQRSAKKNQLAMKTDGV